MAFIMFAVAAILIMTTVYSGRVMDENRLQSQRDAVDNAITNRLSRGLSEMRGVAWWDDMVTYTAPATFDKEWLDLEVGSFMVESNKHSRIAVLDEQNRPIYAYGGDASIGSPAFSEEMKAFQPFIAQARGGIDASPRVSTTARRGALFEQTDEGRKYSRGFGGVAEIGGKPVK